MSSNGKFTRRGMLGSAALAGLAVAGCSSGTAASSTSDGKGSSSEPVKLTLWDKDGDPTSATGKPINDLVKQFNQAHPTIEVTARAIPFGDYFQTVTQAAASGSLPDIMEISATDTVSLAQTGVLMDISSQVKAWGQEKEYFAGPWATTQVGSKTYSIPFIGDDYQLYYNKTMFAAAGLKPPQTWDELEHDAIRLTTSKVFGIATAGIQGIEGSTALLIRILDAGGDPAHINSPAGVAALTQFKRMVDEGCMSKGILTWGEDDMTTEFRNGRAAMMIDSATDVGAIRTNNPNIDFGIAALPKDKVQTTVQSDANLAIAATTRNSAAAWEFVKWTQEPSVAVKYLPARNKISTRKDISTQVVGSDKVRLVFAQALNNTFVPNNQEAPKWNDILTFIQAALQNAVSGTMTVQQALSDSQGKITQTLGS